MLEYLCFLFNQHFIQNWSNPVLEHTVIIIWYQQISYPVDSFISESFSIQIKISHKSWCQTFNKILLYSSSCRNNTINLEAIRLVSFCSEMFLSYHFVLSQISDGLPDPAGGHIWSITQKYGTAMLSFYIFIFLIFIQLLRR